MQLTNQLQAGVPRHGMRPLDAMEDLVATRRVRARRWWIIRSTAFLLFTTMLLILLVVWRRDSLVLQTAMLAMHQPATALQQRLDTLGTLPAVLPQETRDGLQFYIDDIERFYAVHTDKPVIVGSSGVHGLLLRNDGRCVLIHHRGKISVGWLPLSEFRAAILTQRSDMRAFMEQRRSRPPELPR